MDDTIHDPASHDPASGGADAAGSEPQAGPAATAQGHSQAAVLSLRQAMRRARFDDAERSGAVADLRAARLGRLEVLREALAPLLAQIPADVDCFDVGLMPGSNPRLFIDMIGFVEMGRDPRVYHFVQDTRHGRVKLAESETVSVIVEAATHYVARRLLERDKALATDAGAGGNGPDATLASLGRGDTDIRAAHIRTVKARAVKTGATGRSARGLSIAFAFLIDVLGSIAFFSLLAFAAWAAWSSYAKH